MSGIMTAVLPALVGGLQLAGAAVKKSEEAGEINQYIDLAVLQNKLFGDTETREAAYADLYQKIQTIVAKKGIVPSIYWYDEEKQQGAPTISVPVSTLFDLINAALR